MQEECGLRAVVVNRKHVWAVRLKSYQVDEEENEVEQS